MNTFLYRFGSTLFLIFALGSTVGCFLFDTPFNAPFLWAFRYLSIPILLVVVGYTFLNRRELTALAHSRAKVYFLAFMLVPLLILFAGGWAGLLNGLHDGGTTVRYHGTILQKFESRGRSRGCQLVVLDEATGQTVTFMVPSASFASYQVGDFYTRTMRLGCLGIPYERRGR